MIVTVDTDYLEPDAKGEILRSLVFDEKMIEYGHIYGDGTYWSKQTGCYDTFDVFDDYVKIEPDKYPEIYNHIKPNDDMGDPPKVYAYENKDIVAMWWWDGDGDLTIWIKGEEYFYQNTDCKCHYDWHEI